MILEFLVASLIMWLFFIAVSPVVRRYYNKYNKDASLLKKPAKYALGAFILYDILYNVTVGSLLFMQKPPASYWVVKGFENWTFTARLKYNIIEEPKTWRGSLSKFICKRMIEPWHQGHCSL